VQDEEFWATQFDEHRSHLRTVAYRLLGSFADPQPPGSPTGSVAGG
jgi:hypothetical protein